MRPDLASYLAGRRPLGRACVVAWLVFFPIVSGAWYVAEFTVLKGPHADPWMPLFRWLGVSAAAGWLAAWVVVRCARNTAHPIARWVAVLLSLLVPVVLTVLAWPGLVRSL